MLYIEFKYNPDSNDYKGLAWKKLWNSWVVRIYYIIIILTIFSISNLDRFFDLTAYEDEINNMIIICIFSLFIPILIFMIEGGVSVYKFEQLGPISIIFDEKGYGIKGQNFKIFYGWNGFKKIVETKNCMFFYMKNGRDGLIFKRFITKEELDLLHGILKGSSVPYIIKK